MKQIKNHKCGKINVSAPQQQQQQPVVVAVVVRVLRENIVNSFPIPNMVRTIFDSGKCWQFHSSEWIKNSLTAITNVSLCQSMVCRPWKSNFRSRSRRLPLVSMRRFFVGQIANYLLIAACVRTTFKYGFCCYNKINEPKINAAI